MIDGDDGTSWRAPSTDPAAVTLRLPERQRIRSLRLVVNEAAPVSIPTEVEITDLRRPKRTVPREVGEAGDVAVPKGCRPDRLRIRYDLDPRPGKYPVAYTTFGDRPYRTRDGWWPGEPSVFATYRVGGLGNLIELLHETGHGIHIAGIRARPAFADWPDSDTFTESVADIASLDAYEPRWQFRVLGDSVPLFLSMRSKYGGVMWSEHGKGFRSEYSPQFFGEELFAAGAYVGAGASHDASLNAQDILRWLVILAILLGVGLKILGAPV